MTIMSQGVVFRTCQVAEQLQPRTDSHKQVRPNANAMRHALGGEKTARKHRPQTCLLAQVALIALGSACAATFCSMGGLNCQQNINCPI